MIVRKTGFKLNKNLTLSRKQIFFRGWALPPRRSSAAMVGRACLNSGWLQLSLLAWALLHTAANRSSDVIGRLAMGLERAGEKVKLLQDEKPQTTGVARLSPGAAYLTLEALTEVNRPDEEGSDTKPLRSPGDRPCAYQCSAGAEGAAVLFPGARF